ncbi:Uncharacterized protein APZ42_024699 [Daphnia magna]|uniref:Uncharacterized protein n=1 Tax=Daphnia magna TaxID=35525 RepID=A0A164TUL9_9CRUS|nr:Uncharacterized protein APZ42_024699 [Daphnia magna]
MMHVFGVTPWLVGENVVIGVQELLSAGMMSIVACQRHAAVGAKEMVGLCRTELLKVLPRREAMRDSEKGGV